MLLEKKGNAFSHILCSNINENSCCPSGWIHSIASSEALTRSSASLDFDGGARSLARSQEEARERSRWRVCGQPVYRRPLTLSEGCARSLRSGYDLRQCCLPSPFNLAFILFHAFTIVLFLFPSLFFSFSPSLERKGRPSKDTSADSPFSGHGHRLTVSFSLPFFCQNERTPERATGRRRSRRRVARRRHTQSLCASARTWLDLWQAQGQYLSKAASSPGSMLVRARFRGVPPPPLPPPWGGVCFDRDAKKMRVCWIITSQFNIQLFADF